MKPKGGASPMVWVKDKKGNEFLCPLEALKDPKKVSKDELKECLEDASAAFTRND